MHWNTFTSLLFLFFVTSSITSQIVVQNRGVDELVSYESLKQFGPWDDRNYELTAEDLKYLSPNEAELRDPIPAFFRVFMRKNSPNMLKSGPAQYPRSALQIFRLNYYGYLIDNKYYNKVEVKNGQYDILMEEENVITNRKFEQKMALSEVKVTSPAGAAESAIKIHPLDPNIVIAGTNGPGSGQKMHYSQDGGLNWNQVSLPLGGTCCDPTVDYSANGQYAYTATLGNCGGSGCAIWFYRSSDDGKTWTDLQSVTPGDPRRELTNSGSDKEYIHVDKHCGSPYLDNVYLTWHESTIMQFAKSTDKGNSWTKTSFNSDPLGIGSDIVTDHLGNIYYVYPAFNTKQILLKKSTDGGISFDSLTTTISPTQGSFIFPVPSMESRQVFIYTSIDADLSGGIYNGSLYVAWTDSYSPSSQNSDPNSTHSRIQVAYSRDQGATWNTVTPHSIVDQDTVDRYHPWLAVGQDGTVHLVFYDTRRSPNRAGVDLFYCSSLDGGQTFSPPLRLTTEVSPNISDAFEFGDYNGLDHVVRQSSIFTDNRGSAKNVYSTTEIDNGTVNTNPFPHKPSSILGPSFVCPGQENIPFEVPNSMNANSYHWSITDNEINISGNGATSITLSGITTEDTLSLKAQNACGDSAPQSKIISIASEATCNITNCVKSSLSINNDTLALNDTDVFELIHSIESNGTIQNGDYKIFRAGNSIELTQGFTVQTPSVFIAEISDCAASLMQDLKKDE